MDQQLTTIVTGVIMLLIGILVSFFIREPMERLRKRLSDKREDEWNRRKRIEKEIRTRPDLKSLNCVIRLFHLIFPQS